MKSIFKLKYLPVFALVLGGGLAFATATPYTKKANTTIWVRTGSSANPEEDQTWREGSLAEGCEDATKLCKGEFAENYNPNAHSDSENRVNNQSGSTILGYVED